mmetsp:Transcript_14037/g.52586  ORF Transcript_14037/g.52586 Transcript_14037/m.52586 type:complete len:216 (+) Transcript_14037:4568-5215(+)
MVLCRSSQLVYLGDVLGEVLLHRKPSRSDEDRAVLFDHDFGRLLQRRLLKDAGNPRAFHEVSEVVRVHLRVDRGAHDHKAQVRIPHEKALRQHQEQIGIDGPLMHFIDDEVRVRLHGDLVVGHELHEIPRGAVPYLGQTCLVPNAVAHATPDHHFLFLRLRPAPARIIAQAAGRDASRLRNEHSRLGWDPLSSSRGPCSWTGPSMEATRRKGFPV